MEQRTVKQTLMFSGTGIHTGEPCRVHVHPAAANTGRVFLVHSVRIPARADYVIDTTRCTTLGDAGVCVRTVEHLMAALAGCGVDNALIEVDGPEIPILDGSALPFVEAICAGGLENQRSLARVAQLHTPLSLALGDSRMEAWAAPQFGIEVVTTFPGWEEGAAHGFLVIDSVGSLFAGTIAPARTFAFQSEVDALLAAGLAKGGSLENVLIITPPDSFSTPLRVPGEWWRHKVLDMVGDLALIDARLQMTVKGTLPGHTLNTRFAQALLAHPGLEYTEYTQ